jgi:hypothetical protein
MYRQRAAVALGNTDRLALSAAQAVANPVATGSDRVLSSRDATDHGGPLSSVAKAQATPACVATSRSLQGLAGWLDREAPSRVLRYSMNMCYSDQNRSIRLYTDQTLSTHGSPRKACQRTAWPLLEVSAGDRYLGNESGAYMTALRDALRNIRQGPACPQRKREWSKPCGTKSAITGKPG